MIAYYIGQRIWHNHRRAVIQRSVGVGVEIVYDDDGNVARVSTDEIAPGYELEQYAANRFEHEGEPVPAPRWIPLPDPKGDQH